MLELLKDAQGFSLVLVGIVVASVLYWTWSRVLSKREEKALALVEDMAALGDVVPDTIHPVIDTDRCIGSGACVRVCPEKTVLQVVHGQARLVNPLACIGHSACLPACPVNAIKLVFGTAERGVELPRVDQNFQTERPGIYVIGELGGMGLIRNAVLQGKQAADHVVGSGRIGGSDAYDAVVVGAGPAGISATLRLMEGQKRVILLERESLGGTIMHYPRAKVAMTGALEFALVGTVRRAKISKEELIQMWQSIVQQTNMPIQTGVLVEGVDSDRSGAWVLQTSSGPVKAANVLLAVGRRGTPQRLGVDGEEQAKVHYRLLEPEAFHGKDVLVVGGGNSAVESALSLADSGGCKSVSISYRRGAFARCRAENRRRIDELIANGSVRGYLPSEVARIDPGDVVLNVSGTMTRVPNDAVIVQIGGTAPSDLLRKFGISLVTKHGEA
ncbi:MAG TPA: NAD(P)-binding domain-containing protein [Polyangiaceae bacterium]|nr:NAD(P)-binding domain-containing protein [Polyangiaceae bacterium]